MLHETNIFDDQITPSGGPGSSTFGSRHLTALLCYTQPKRLYAISALCHPGSESLSQDRLSWRRCLPRRLYRTPSRSRLDQGATLFDPQLCRTTALKKGESVLLLFHAVTSAVERGLIQDLPTAAVDATGLESRHTSPYFLKRASRSKTARPWTKLTTAVDTGSHFITGATVSTGPSNDSPQFRPVLAQASLAVQWDRILADAAFDSEPHHTYVRQDLGIRSTVIPINPRAHNVLPSGKYREQMTRRFRPKPEGSRYKRVFGQRWQAESAFSRHKRRLGSSLSNRSDKSRERECLLRVLTHDLMLLASTA